ncbi:DUF4292 domain-containing protein [Aquimarina aggregata]|uniref:DUF4292 domain-containing protein n=1 Tax=Aquimarina aggregata TaxID=1642818 RepID=UPI00082B4FEF|nr:DUF4292 domain-containing protein [Aquimarina aggregata]
MSKIRIVGYMLFSLVLLSSCKSTNAVTGTRLKKLSSEKIIANHYNRSFNFETLNAKLRVKYDDGKNSYSPAVTLRMEKDKAIWISVKMIIPLAKVLITPEKVSYYEKINNTYFEGDFTVLSEWLGTNDLDFDKVQQMLLGQALFNLRKDKYKSTVTDQTYQLVPKADLALFERLFLIRPDSFKMASQQLKQPIENRNLAINYHTYQKIGNQDFPKQIGIEAVQGDETTRIDIEYKAVDYNAKVSFPFKIPSGYKEVTIQ